MLVCYDGIDVSKKVFDDNSDVLSSSPSKRVPQAVAALPAGVDKPFEGLDGNFVGACMSLSFSSEEQKARGGADS